MKDKLRKAIRNNNGLYEAVFSSHQIESHKTDFIWYSTEETPPLYSNLVTLSADWKPDEIFSSIVLKYEKEAWEEWSIKDSFDVLDFTQYGFTKLFDARWLYLEADDFTPAVDSPKLRYEILKSADALSEWRLAWDADELLGKKIFDAKLLDNQKVYFVAGYRGDEILCGCFVNRTDDVLGISNFFAPGEALEHWPEMIAFILASIERLDIVGYERRELAEKLQALGFESIGNLSVWLKKRAGSYQEN